MHQRAAITKAEALIEANQYIQRFRDKVVVVKVGGSVQEDEDKLRALLTDISFMSAVGMRPVIVHGGGKSITAAMEKAGLAARFVQGRRYTDRQTLEIAERVLCQEINHDLVEHLRASGAQAIGLHSMGSCVLFGRRMFLSDKPSATRDNGSHPLTSPPSHLPASPSHARGSSVAAPARPAVSAQVDIGFVGEVTEVNTILLNALCEDGFIPVLAPIAISRTGYNDGEGAGGVTVYKLNVNADTAAGTVAAALKAEKLVMMSDTHGIRTDPSGDPDSYVSNLTKAEIADLVARGIIGEGMLPKVEACLTALEAGVPKAHIIDGRIPHSVLLEIYTDAGIGTQIVLE